MDIGEEKEQTVIEPEEIPGLEPIPTEEPETDREPVVVPAGEPEEAPPDTPPANHAVLVPADIPCGIWREQLGGDMFLTNTTNNRPRRPDWIGEQQHKLLNVC